MLRPIDTVKKLLKFALNYENYRDKLLKEFLFDFSQKISPIIAIDYGNIRLLVYTKDRFVGRSIFIHGPQERELLGEILPILKGQNQLNGSIFVDIGANIGSASIYAIHEFGFKKAILFEPDPDNVMILKHNFLANNLLEQAEIFPIAVSDRHDIVQFERSDINLGDHRVRVKNSDLPDNEKITDKFDECTRQVITVPCDTLDNIFEKANYLLTDIGIVWMDAQGHEGHILRGASKLLNAEIPIVTEFWPYALKRAGGLDYFLYFTKKHFSSFADLRAIDTQVTSLRPISELDNLLEKYTETRLTDLLLLK